MNNYAHRKLFPDETQAYHEGIPGHHMQISIQQRLTGLPEFRLHVINNAYAEGWAVYAEALGKEIGFFQDPASDYGRLSLELMRAVRLVVIFVGESSDSYGPSRRYRVSHSLNQPSASPKRSFHRGDAELQRRESESEESA